MAFCLLLIGFQTFCFAFCLFLLTFILLLNSWFFFQLFYITENVDGMIHISKLSSKRVERVEDVVNIGDRVEVEVIKIDERGRVDLKLIKKL